MKIVYLHHRNICENTANNIQVLSMCNAFALNDCDVTLFIPNTESYTKTVEAIELKLGRKINFHVEQFRYFNLRSITLSTYISLLAFKSKSEFRRKLQKADFVFTRQIIVYLLLRSLASKIIFEIHNSYFFDRNLINNYVISRLRYYSKKSNTLLILISENLKKYWENQLPDYKMIALHDGVNSESFKVQLSKSEARKKLGFDLERKIVSYIGSMYFDREIENVIKLVARFKDVLFVMVGGPSKNVEYFKSLCSSEGVNNMIFTGYVAHPQVPDYMYASDILLALWSDKVSTINYCSPLKLFEYMASGRVVAAHGYITIREVIQDKKNGFLVDPASSDALINVIENILTTDDDKLEEISYRARKEAMNNYSWKKRAEIVCQSLI